MSRKGDDPDVIVRVSYVTDPENAKAAQEILKEGFRRGLLKKIQGNTRKDS